MRLSFLPFVFVYIILYAVLEKTKVLGTENEKPRRNLNSIVAFVIGFIFITAASRVEDLTMYLQILGMGLVFVMSVLFLFAAYNEQKIFEKTNYIYAIAFVFVAVAFFYSMGFWNDEKWDFIFELVFNPVVIMVVTFYILVMFITGGFGGKKSNVAEVKKELDQRAEKKGERTV